MHIHITWILYLFFSFFLYFFYTFMSVANFILLRCRTLIFYDVFFFFFDTFMSVANFILLRCRTLIFYDVGHLKNIITCATSEEEPLQMYVKINVIMASDSFCPAFCIFYALLSLNTHWFPSSASSVRILSQLSSERMNRFNTFLTQCI
jgi:DMSO reductase anchor subunit